MIIKTSDSYVQRLGVPENIRDFVKGSEVNIFNLNIRERFEFSEYYKVIPLKRQGGHLGQWELKKKDFCNRVSELHHTRLYI